MKFHLKGHSRSFRGHLAVISRWLGLRSVRLDQDVSHQFLISSKKTYSGLSKSEFRILTARYHYKHIRPLCLTTLNRYWTTLALCERKNSKPLVWNHLNITLDSIHTWTYYSNIFKGFHDSRVSIAKEHWLHKKVILKNYKKS